MAKYCFETLRYRNPALRFALGTTFITFALSFSCSALNLQLGVNPANPLENSAPSVHLTWDAPVDGVYLVQSKTNLADGVWKTEEPVKSNVGPIKWMAPESLERSKYYQLVLPQPEIFSIAPAVGLAGVPMDVYLIGQGFGSNDTILIDGVVPTNVHFISPTLFQVTFTPDIAVNYDFTLNSSSTGQSSTVHYAWSLIQQPAGSQARLSLKEPPQEPPASPVSVVKDNTIGGTRNTGTGPNGQGLRSYSGGKFGIEIDGKAAFEVQEGKKGLNAVNVKLARQRFDHNPCDTSELKSFSGELQHEVVDMVIPGRSLDFVWVRTYRSRTGTNTAMGNGWDFSYDLSIQPLGGDILVHDDTGRADRFFRQTNGTYSAPEFFSEGTFGKGIFTLTFPDTGKWVFNPLDSSVQAGKISQIVDRNGNAMTFGYDGSGRLTTVIDDLGRTNTIAYNSDGLIQSVTDFSGRAVTYHYYAAKGPGSPGDLQSFTTPPVVGTPNTNDFPAGKTTTYAYTTGFADDTLNHNLLSITDPLNQTSLQFVYQTNQNPANLDYDAVDYVQHGPYRIKLRRFPQTPTPSNDFAVVKCVLNDGVGNVSECFYDSQNRCVRQLYYTGRANPDLPTTEASNRPTGKLRADDPDFYETRCAWNLDSLCTRITQPNGNATVCVYERDFDKNASPRKKGDLRIVRELACCSGADTDGDGQNDLTERAWHLSYDPRFGSPATCRGKKLYVGNLPFSADSSSRFASGPRQTTSDGSTAQWPALAVMADFNSGPRQTTSLDCTSQARYAREAFLSTAQSAREMKLSSGQPTIIDNKKGLFVTRVIDPRRSVTLGTYDPHGNLLECVVDWRVDTTPPDLAVTDFEYNQLGQTTTCVRPPDANGLRRRDEFAYYGSGPQAGYLATWTVDTQGPTLIRTSLEYDARGNVTRCTDPQSFVTDIVYNQLDQVVAVMQDVQLLPRLRLGTVPFYDANDRLVQVDAENRDATGALDATNPQWTTLYQYDSLNRCIRMEQERDPSHNVATEFQYDANDNLVLHRSPEAVNGNDPNNVVRYQYDERDLLFRAAGAPGTGLGVTNEWSYTPNGRIRRINFEILVEDRAYDGFDRLVSATDPMGNVDVCAYDANDNLVYHRCDGEMNDLTGGALNRRLSETRCTYDGLNRCVQTRASFFDGFSQSPIGDGAAVSTCAYAPNGRIKSETDDNGHTTVYTYDSVNRLAMVTDPKSNVVLYNYDASGNVVTQSSVDHSDLAGPEQDFVMTFVYDGFSRCVSATDNVGNTDQCSYDSRNNVIRFVDKNENVIRCTYDGLNRALAVTHDLPGSASYQWTCQWNDNSCCIARIDSNNNPTHYAYDSLDRMVATTNADQTVESLIWSPRSNLSSRTDPNGTVVSYTYDLLDRCVHSDITPGSGVAATTTFESFQYDGLSRCVMASNNVSRLDFSYDSLGNRVGAGQDGLTTLCTFDGVGNRLSMTYPGGRIVQSTYDALDRVSTLITTRCEGCGNPWLGIANYAYDGPDRLSAIFRTNGVNTRIRWNGLQNPGNSPGDFGWQQVAGIAHVHGVGAAAQVLDRRIFAYDHNQNKTNRAQTDPFVQGGDTTTNLWSYDVLNQLTRAINTKGTGATVRSYHLDGQGNRLEVTNDVTVEVYTRDASLPEPADFQMDQYSVTPFGTEQHDRNGNLVQTASSAGPTAYLYDYADRLVEVDGLDSQGKPAPVVSFTYDALGRRISKTTYPPVPAAPLTIQYVHGGDLDRDGILEERVNGAVSRVYSWGHNSYPGEKMDRVAFTGGGEPIYYQADELGNVLALTDATGAVLERYEYDDYGTPSFLTSDGVPQIGSDGLPATQSAFGNPYLFHGMSWDAETALYHDSGMSGENPLYQDPKKGRYLSRGGDTGDCGYSGNNPWTAGMIRSKNKHYGDYLPAHNFKLEIDGVVGGGMLHLHQQNIVHRDLAARNFLLSGTPTPTPEAVSAGRDCLKGTTKTQGDFNLSHRFSVEIDGCTVGSQSRAINTKGTGATVRTVSNVLKTRHDTVKNSIGNIR
jgi:YD repeat-containing protein